MVIQMNEDIERIECKIGQNYSLVTNIDDHSIILFLLSINSLHAFVQWRMLHDSTTYTFPNHSNLSSGSDITLLGNFCKASNVTPTTDCLYAMSNTFVQEKGVVGIFTLSLHVPTTNNLKNTSNSFDIVWFSL